MGYFLYYLDVSLKVVFDGSINQVIKKDNFASFQMLDVN